MTRRSGSSSDRASPGLFRALWRGLRRVVMNLIGAAVTTFTFWIILSAAAFFLAFFYFGAGS